MKQNNTFKSVLIFASVLSLFAFAFVNLRANSSLNQPFEKIQMEQNHVESEDAGETEKIPVPDVSVLGRVWEIAQRLLDHNN